jgi:hypothetical protein
LGLVLSLTSTSTSFTLNASATPLDAGLAELNWETFSKRSGFSNRLFRAEPSSRPPPSICQASTQEWDVTLHRHGYLKTAMKDNTGLSCLLSPIGCDPPIRRLPDLEALAASQQALKAEWGKEAAGWRQIGDLQVDLLDWEQGA